MKKMKGVVAAQPSSYALYQDSRARFKHQSLMQDYEELQKEGTGKRPQAGSQVFNLILLCRSLSSAAPKTQQHPPPPRAGLDRHGGEALPTPSAASIRFRTRDLASSRVGPPWRGSSPNTQCCIHKDAEAMKNRLEMMKQKKSILAAEVRFLRRRYKYLIGKQSMNPKPKQDLVQTHNLKIQRTEVLKGKNSNKKESALRYPAPAMDLNQRVRINNAMEAALQKSTPNSDLNHKARTASWKETTLHNSNPVIDLNQKEMILSGKESTKRKSTPVFDLNQVSLEEEEDIQANCEPLRIDEPNKSILRGGIDEQHNDMKLPVCRTIGNGSNRSGKRKITWQDQVALRV